VRLPERSADVFAVATWFGLTAGLLEGAVFMLSQRLGWLGQELVVNSVTLEIVWVAALFNLLLFNAVAVALLGLASIVRRLPLATAAVFLFSAMASEDLIVLTLTGHLHAYALVILGIGLGATVTRWARRREHVAFRFWRRSLPWVGAAALIALVGIQGGFWVRERLALAALPPMRSDAPSVLVIVADTLRADHLSAYGYARPTSPNIDRIAGQGVLFEQAFAASSWTAPSHASVLTGLYPSQHGVEWHHSAALVGARYPTLAEALRDRGYRTAAFSANIFWFTRARGFDRGFIRFEDYFRSIGDAADRPIYGRIVEKLVLRRLGFEDIPGRRRAADINRSLLRWIDRDPGRPFFAFLNYMDTHDPYLPPRPYRTRFSKLANPGGLLNERVRREVPLGSEQQQGEIDAYDGAVAYVDDQIGMLVQGLRHRGLADRTLLVITADHGESLGERGLFLHANGLSPQELHVPLIFVQPGRLPSAARVARPVTNAALPASVMDLVGGDPSVFRARSLRPLWENPGGQPNWPDPIAEIARIPWALPKAPARRGWMKAMVTPRWYYVLHQESGAELYDRETDPGQRVNLAQQRDMSPLVGNLNAQLLRGLADNAFAPAKP
jgi:arylsulfatase A-like enzyme